MKTITFISILLVNVVVYAQTTYNFTNTLDAWFRTGTGSTLTAGATAATLNIPTPANNISVRQSDINTDVTSLKYVVVTLASNATSANQLRLIVNSTAGTYTVGVDCGTVSISGNVATWDMTANGSYTGVMRGCSIALRESNSSTINTGGDMVIDKIEFTNTLTSPSPTKLKGVSVRGYNGEITVIGANLDGVYNIVGQKVAAEGLSSGIYMVKISNTTGSDVVKLVL